MKYQNAIKVGVLYWGVLFFERYRIKIEIYADIENILGKSQSIKKPVIFQTGSLISNLKDVT